MIKKILRPYAKPALLAATAALLSACSLVRYQPIATINKIDLNSGYRFETDRQSQNNADGDDTYIVLMFSGGGTRAAALGYGVLEQLNRQKVNIGGREKTLMQNVDVVIGVSGGSVLAAYFALHGQDTIPSFDRRFLRLNFQKLMTKQVFSFANLPRLTSPEFGRGDLLQEQFETHLFGKATFADLEKRRKGPFAIISATDMGLGERINFTQEYFDLMCTNLGDLRIARAVAASSAVPMVFAPVTLNNNGGNCNYSPPKDTAQAAVSGQNAQQNKTRQEYVTRYRRYDSKTCPYIHLLDGGLTDNLGMRSLLDMADVYSSSMLMRRMTDHNIRRVVIISVNARNRINSDIDTKAAVPGFRNVLSSIVDIPIDRYSQESLRRLRAFADKWNEDNRNADDSKKIALSFVSLSLDDLPKSELRNDVLNIPTSFYLPPDDIAKLRTAAAILMKQSPEYKKLLEDLSAKPNKAAIYQETAVLPRTVSQSELDEINNPKAGADNGGNSDNDGK